MNVEDISILVAHCRELPPSYIEALVAENVAVLDLCVRKLNSTDDDDLKVQLNEKLEYQNHSKNSRRRSFFCKPAALLSSPFDETMLLDHDVIWFGDPFKLWYFPEYLQTGSLFFLDR